MESSPNKPPQFIIIGCGGAGTTFIDRIGKTPISNILTIAIDTDNQALVSRTADVHILLGKDLPRRLGEGNPTDAGAAAVGARLEIKKLIKPADCVFILAGLGKGAGSGAAPKIAKIARDQGALVIAVVTIPFRIEKKTIDTAEKGLQNLLDIADSVIVLDNHRFRNVFSNLPLEKVYTKVDEMIVDLLQGLIETVTVPSLINIDYTDFHALFFKKGLSMILSGESGEGNRNENVVRECWAYPSFDIDYRSATGCIMVITAGNDFGTYDVEEIAMSLTYEIVPHADVTWGTRIKSSFNGKVLVYGIMTGIKQPSSSEINQNSPEKKSGGTS